MLNGSVAISDPAEKISLRLAVANGLNKAFIVTTLTSVHYARANLWRATDIHGDRGFQVLTRL